MKLHFNRKKAFADLAKGAFAVFVVAGVVSSARTTMNFAFQERTIPNEDYNPSAVPEYQEVCNYSYGVGETCGEALLNATEFERETTYYEFFNDNISNVLVGHNWWDEDDLVNPLLILLGLYSGLAWAGWKRISRSHQLSKDELS